MARRRREAGGKTAAAGGAAALLVLAASWPRVWPYLLGVVVAAGLGGLVWWLWRTDRVVRGGDREWRRADAVEAGRRTLAEVDAMSGTEFEELVAELCRRDGCTGVRRVGGSHDNGADVVGRLPDGRTMVVQCKRYAPNRTVASREMRDLMGARVHFRADVAVFVTTSRFSGPAQALAVEHGILAVHRDHLGLWNNGTPLHALAGVNGAGQGDREHRARWKRTYGT